MTAKDFLSRAFLLNQEIIIKEEQIIKLRELSFSVSSAVYGEKVQTSRKNDRIGDLITRIQDLIDDYAKDITSLLFVKNEISEVIKKVPDPISRLLLEKRYINYDSWDKIAKDINYTERHIYNLHKKALNDILVYIEIKSSSIQK